MSRLGGSIGASGALAALLLAGCGKAPDAPAASAPAPADAPAPAATAAPATPSAMRLRGAGLMGKDGYGFTLCGEDTQRIATLEPAAKAVLEAFLAGGAREFRIDAWGDLVGSDKLTLRAIERVGTEGLGCDEREFRYLFKAYGTEPFWNLDLDVAQGTFSRPDHESVSGEMKQAAPGENGVRQFSVDTLAGRIEATLTPGPCNDGMSDTTFGWTSQVTTGGETLRGCAYAGPAARWP